MSDIPSAGEFLPDPICVELPFFTKQPVTSVVLHLIVTAPLECTLVGITVKEFIEGTKSIQGGVAYWYVGSPSKEPFVQWRTREIEAHVIGKVAVRALEAVIWYPLMIGVPSREQSIGFKSHFDVDPFHI